MIIVSSSPKHLHCRLKYLLFAVSLFVFSPLSYALPQDIPAEWFQADAQWRYAQHGGLTAGSGLTPTTGISLTGGRFWFQGEFEIQQAGRYVLDFKNTSTIDHFRHFILDEHGALIGQLEGGIQSSVFNPFFMRHGRELELSAGHYRLVGELESPFFLAQPEPYLNALTEYQVSINPANAMVLIGLGVYLGLGIYYATLSLARRRITEGMYAVFILCNLLMNGSALLVFSGLFGLHWIYLVGLPLLFSNVAYIRFVMSLLEIRSSTHPRLYKTGRMLLLVMALFILLALLRPHWSLELSRYGVGLFLIYGLSSGIVRAREGNISARLYLVAIAVFFTIGGVAISSSQLGGVHTFYIEHVGMLAVVVEVILLSLVVTYQFGQLHFEKERMRLHLEHSKRIAYRDALTGLPNRYVLDKELAQLPEQGSLTFIDLDRLKYYNDHYGHARGDELLQHFAHKVQGLLAERARIFRVGGDEFAITCAGGDVAWISACLHQAIAEMHLEGFEFAGVSAGSAHLHESVDLSQLKHLADMRMYQSKEQKRRQREQASAMPLQDLPVP